MYLYADCIRPEGPEMVGLHGPDVESLSELVERAQSAYRMVYPLRGHTLSRTL